MKLAIISDTHSCHGELDVALFDKCDTVIHCGDMCNRGIKHELNEFSFWFASLKPKNKICIAGNHDRCLDTYAPNPYEHPVDEKENEKLLTDKGIIYLRDSSITIDGIKFYGTPSQPPFCDWAFNDRELIREMKYDMIPKDVDVLITHSPPYMILDECHSNVGCELLANRVREVKPKIHCFGHIHEARGELHQDGIHYINAACMVSHRGTLAQPIFVEI